MENETNKFGLSRKTNIAIAAMTTISTAQNSTVAIIAITSIAILGAIIQFYIDCKHKPKSA